MNKKVKCNLCDHVATKGNLRVHMSSKHDGTQFACDQCGIFLTTALGLKGHIQIKHENIRHPRKYCEFQATKKQILKEHIRWKLQCDLCGFEVNTKTGLQEHKHFKDR